MMRTACLTKWCENGIIFLQAVSGVQLDKGLSTYVPYNESTATQTSGFGRKENEEVSEHAWYRKMSTNSSPRRIEKLLYVKTGSFPEDSWEFWKYKGDNEVASQGHGVLREFRRRAATNEHRFREVLKRRRVYPISESATVSRGLQNERTEYECAWLFAHIWLSPGNADFKSPS
ncbi:hypothetical protein CPB85DRAFT_1454394 [Mucidula mucida]|nr:hypothetical protein CPB85DRAFT_1454394 [Mucidula mucida]